MGPTYAINNPWLLQKNTWKYLKDFLKYFFFNDLFMTVFWGKDRFATGLVKFVAILLRKKRQFFIRGSP